MLSVVEEFRYYSKEHSLLARAILMLLILAFAIFVSFDPYRWTPFAALDLVIHEIGHPLFGIFGEWMGYAGGTILQHLVPIICAIILLRQREYFAIPFCGIWFSANILETARYIASTDNPHAPLVTLGFSGETPDIHYTDWEYLLDNTPGLSMEYASTVSTVVKIVGITSMWFFVIVGFRLLWHMYKIQTFSTEIRENT